jgi:hypothetical protein
MQRNWSKNLTKNAFWPPPTTDPSHVPCLASPSHAIVSSFVVSIVPQVGNDLGSQSEQSCEPAESDAASGMNDI